MNERPFAKRAFSLCFDHFRLFVDELDDGTVVTLHRSQEEALIECVEPPQGSVVWNATSTENFIIQADLLTQSGLQFFAGEFATDVCIYIYLYMDRERERGFHRDEDYSSLLIAFVCYE